MRKPPFEYFDIISYLLDQTHESTFEQLRPTSTPTLTEAHSTESHFKPSTATSSRLPVHSKELLSSHQNLLLQKEKLEQARKRREGVRKVRESRLAATNRRRAETSLIARQQHWAEDFQRAHDSELLRRTCEEQVVMRKVRTCCVVQRDAGDGGTVGVRSYSMHRSPSPHVDLQSHAAGNASVAGRREFRGNGTLAYHFSA